MTTATNPTSRNNPSRWLTRTVAAVLLACGPALVALGAAPDSVADTGGSKVGGVTVNHPTTLTRAVPSISHVTNGAVKHHHLHYLRATNPLHR